MNWKRTVILTILVIIGEIGAFISGWGFRGMHVSPAKSDNTVTVVQCMTDSENLGQWCSDAPMVWIPSNHAK